MMKNVVLLTLLLGACGLDKSSQTDASPSNEGSVVTGKVKYCHDGDTCQVVEIAGRDEPLTVRLAGIDAPEVSGGEDGHGQPFGKEAREFLEDMVKGKAVKVKEVEPDPYGRTVAEIFVGSKLVNIQIVENGYAEYYKYADPRIDRTKYKEAMERAQDAKLNIWTQGDDYQSPGDFRHGQD